MLFKKEIEEEDFKKQIEWFEERANYVISLLIIV